MARTIAVEHNGSTLYGKVARIKATSLGKEDHGILTAYLHCEGDGWGIGVGGYALDHYDETAKQRIPTAYGLDQVMEMTRVAGVNNWEQVPGQRVLVLFDSENSWGGTAVGIAHVEDEDRILVLKEHAAKWAEVFA